MDALDKLLERQLERFRSDPNLKWIPVRHHSPACSYFLRDALQARQPDRILLECPIDFEAQLPGLMDSTTEAPVALYGRGGFYPFSASSPEWIAIKWASLNDKPIHFIDLPLAEKAWSKEVEDGDTFSYLHESQLDHSQFIQTLVKSSGVRNSHELWEDWFETKEFNSSEDFFDQVFRYCAAARMTYSEEAIASSADTLRENFMASKINELYQANECTFVVTGGFHTLGLFDWQDSKYAKEIKNCESWLIRYSQERLDAKSGYPAGMLAPAFQEALLSARYDNCSPSDLILQCLERISATLSDNIKINSAAKLEISEHLQRLCHLRGHLWPNIHDIMDSLKSVLVKHELTAEEPILNSAYLALSGNNIGSIGRSQALLPIVEELIQQLKRERFKVDTSTKASTSIPVHDESKSSRLAILYQCDFLSIPFAKKIQGPDLINGINLHLIYEHWEYAWTPSVEARLIELLVDGATLRSVLKCHIQRQLVALADEPLVAHGALLIKLSIMQCLSDSIELWDSLNKVIPNTTDTLTLCQFLNAITQLKINQPFAFKSFENTINGLIDSAWNQLMFCLPNINSMKLDQGLYSLLQAHDLARDFGLKNQSIWCEIWSSRLDWLIQYGELSVALQFACNFLKTRIITDEAQRSTALETLISKLKALFDLKNENAYDALYALLYLDPTLLSINQDSSLLSLMNLLLLDWDDAAFLDALPKLRSLLSAFDPKDIENLGERVALLNHWTEVPELFATTISDSELIEAQTVHCRVLKTLHERGLGHWMNN